MDRSLHTKLPISTWGPFCGAEFRAPEGWRGRPGGGGGECSDGCDWRSERAPPLLTLNQFALSRLPLRNFIFRPKSAFPEDAC